MSYLSAFAGKYNYSFSNTPISEAIVKIIKEHPEINISFIYKELDNYKTSAKIDTDDAYEALVSAIGLNPVTITTKKGSFYIEALQHGKYMYNGSVVDVKGNPVEAATVIFQNPGDSTVITYGLTDGEGLFSIPCDKRDVIAKISCLGYKTTYRNLDSFNAGTITMHESAIKLPSVTVEENPVTAYSDKTVYVPTKRQRSAAQNAVDLLKFMAIPQIRIKPITNSVTDNFGQEVVLYVNGLEASEGELEGLKTADVRRVEYLEFPTDSRYRGAHAVINFVVQEYVFGGYTMASVSENFLIGLSSRANMFSKFAYGKMRYDLYVASNNFSSRHIGSSLSGSYRLKSKDGEDIIAGRDEPLDKTRYKRNKL
ncbi:MAG: carboxypeptidase-like regulatory domain-containing protein, partial [Paramuribaculum sp.]|nr:carboxypeptidase-like regulatory domain-containing protein [Paramuribaculum sp.]